MSKKELNILSGNLWTGILRFALPLAMTGILQQMFNAADIAVVGRFTGDLGAQAMAAVGANTPILGLVVMTFIGLVLGTNVVIANAIGRDDPESVQKAVHTSILLAVAGGVLIAIIGEIFAVSILASQNVPEEVLPMAVLYFRIYVAGLPVIMLYNFESAIFRSVGDTRTPLYVLILSGIVNVLLNLFFVIVLHMTVDGVATATVLSNALSSILLLYRLVRTDSVVKVSLKNLRMDRVILIRILRIGIPAAIQSAVFSIANIIIQAAINSLGTTVMAASSAAFNLEIFAYNMLNSFSQACTTFVGQNYGAGNMRRCRQTAVWCMVEGTVALVFAVCLILLSGRMLLSLFNSDPEVIAIGYSRLVIIFFAYIFTLTYEMIGGYLRGFGISMIPAILTIIGICGVRITWIYTVFPAHHTFQNIMIAYPVSLAATAALLLIALMILRPGRAEDKKQLY